MNGHYVYACYVNGVVKYIGMGKGQRFKHCKSGKSSCVELNRDFFNGENMETVIVRDGMTRDEALMVESTIISDIGSKNLYNIREGVRDDLQERSLEFIDDLFVSISKNDIVTFSFVKKTILKLMEKHGNPICHILERATIVKLLSIFGYKHKSGKFTKISNVDAVHVLSYLNTKLVRVTD